MKKTIGILLSIIILLTLTSCKKNISSEQLLEVWDKTVNKTSDILIEQRDLDINNKKSVSSLIDTIDEHKENIKKNSAALNDSKAIETTMGKELNKIYALNITTLDVIKKEINQQQISDKENEAPGLLGKRTTEFAEQYNNGKLPDSLEMFINLKNKDDEKYKELKDESDKLVEDIKNQNDEVQKSIKNLQEAFK